MVKVGKWIAKHKYLIILISILLMIPSVIGMAKGISAIPDYWRKPIKNKLHTGIFGLETVDIDKRIDLNMEHIGNIK